MEKTWTEKFHAWRTNTERHWAWRKTVDNFLRRKADREEAQRLKQDA